MLPPRIGDPGLQIGIVFASSCKFSLSLFRGSSYCIARHCW